MLARSLGRRRSSSRSPSIALKSGHQHFARVIHAPADDVISCQHQVMELFEYALEFHRTDGLHLRHFLRDLLDFVFGELAENLGAPP